MPLFQARSISEQCPWWRNKRHYLPFISNNDLARLSKSVNHSVVFTESSKQITRTFGFDAVHNITVARFIVIFREEFTSFDPLSWCPVHEGADNVPRRMKNEPTIFLRFLLSIGHNTLLETIRKRSLYIAIFYRSIKYSLFRYRRGIDSTVRR